MKIIKLENCEACPHLTWRNLVEPRCTLMNMKGIDSEYPMIPSWCPLSDLEDYLE